MRRPPYTPTCPRECHFDQWRNLPNMQWSPDDAISAAEDRASGRAILPAGKPYLFQNGVSF